MRAAPRSRQRGVALVLVIWLATLLTVVTASFVFTARSDALVVANSVSMARAEAAADAGVMRAVWETYRIDNAPEMWRRDGKPREMAFDGALLKVEMRDESARIDINTASDALLRGLLVSVGLPDEEATRLVDAIADWRDPDTLKRLNGAEESDYQAAGLAYRPANAPFQAIEEIQLVLGMRPDIYRRIAPLITVYSRQAGVSPTIATREVLLAIPGIAPEVVDAYIVKRDQALAENLPAPAFPEAGQYASAPNGSVASIRSEARLEDGTVFVRDAVALMRPVPRRPVTFLAWRIAPIQEDKPAEGAATAPGAPAAAPAAASK
jgi:general secretion pathway protein K